MGAFEHAAIIMNPAAQHGKVANLVGKVRSLFDGRLDYELHLTEAPWHAQALARQAARGGADVIVAAGGDGTVHECANGILTEGAKVALAVLPLGSGNDYRRTLGISTNVNRAVDQIIAGKTKRVDVGVLNGKYFTNSVGIGLDGRVAHRAADLKEERQVEGLRLYMSALMDIIAHDFHGYRATVSYDDGRPQEVPFLMLAITNGFSYGGGFLVTPQAVNGDGLLDYCIVDDLPRADAMWRIPLVVVGRHNWMGKVHTGRACKLRIVSEEEIPTQIDGEPFASKEFDIMVLPRVLTAVIGDGRVA